MKDFLDHNHLDDCRQALNKSCVIQQALLDKD